MSEKMAIEQLDLNGMAARDAPRIVKVEREEGPWSHVCSYSCWHVLEEKCVCRCGGLYHGYAFKIRFEGQKKLDLEEEMGPEQVLEKLAEARDLATGKGAAMDPEDAIPEIALTRRVRAPGLRPHPGHEDEEPEAPMRILITPGRVGR